MLPPGARVPDEFYGTHRAQTPIGDPDEDDDDLDDDDDDEDDDDEDDEDDDEDEPMQLARGRFASVGVDLP